MPVISLLILVLRKHIESFCKIILTNVILPIMHLHRKVFFSNICRNGFEFHKHYYVVII